MARGASEELHTWSEGGPVMLNSPFLVREGLALWICASRRSAAPVVSCAKLGGPNFVMFEHLSSVPTSGRKSVLWRHIHGFYKVKPTPQQGPKATGPKVVKPLVCQAADYARLHLSTQPFQLFSVGLLVFGSQFCAAIFDCAGVLFSPIHDMWKDTETFIRVIRSLTCLLSSVELGQDPTVTTLPDQQHKLWRNQTKQLGC